MPFEKKNITKREKEFATVMALEDLSPIEAARRVYGWACEPYTKEAMRAKDIARSRRVQEHVKFVKGQDKREAAAEGILGKASRVDWDNLRAFAYDRLKEIRDDEHTNSRSRWEAIKGLERLADPGKDINLIWLWIDEMWRGYTVHCPCCHKNTPLAKIRNEKLNEFRKKNGYLSEPPPLNTEIERIKSSVQPLLTLDIKDRYDLGAEFFRWEFATAVAGAILGIHPFDQPNVQKAKDAT